MKFKILSHAGLLVEVGGTKLVVDPWILGSCYWRSWWNYPKAAKFSTEDVSYIYLTHIHWDHFHGPSLRKFPQSTTVLVPQAFSTRLLDDLADFGFKAVVELPHGKTVRLAPELSVTSYQFDIDSTLVIDDGKTTIVNMNDCKITGWPLRRMMRRHPKVDFMLRSHSSAQPYPFCFDAEDKEDLRFRNNEDYVADFVASAGLLKPRYAVPFASNHCFLHEETRRYNDTVVNPLRVKEYFDGHKPTGTECVVMVAGDSWDDQSGFQLQEQDFFTNRERHLQEYAEEMAPVLQEQYRREANVTMQFRDFDKYFSKLMKSLPWFSRFLFKPIVVFELQGQPDVHWVLDFHSRQVYEAKSGAPNYSICFRVHPLVLKDCAQKGMLTVFLPSKRMTVKLKKGCVKDYLILSKVFDLFDYRFLPISGMLTSRSLQNWARRWREIAHFATLALRAMFKRDQKEALAEFVPRTAL
jgi:UDP-MurNAc hydroxylase